MEASAPKSSDQHKDTGPITRAALMSDFHDSARWRNHPCRRIVPRTVLSGRKGLSTFREVRWSAVVVTTPPRLGRLT